MHSKTFRILATCLVLAGSGVAHAKQSAAPAPQPAIAVTSDVSYQFLARWDVATLNKILTSEAEAFSGLKVAYTPATNAVNLYRVTYASVVPERGNRPIVATGLVAIPELKGKSFPLVSYQHGTVYKKTEVPSIPDESFETKLMIAQFAGQGYVVTGADYFGMGNTKEPEGYVVKKSHQQATEDMLRAARAVLAARNVTASELFIAGWSQGGFVTMALAERLEANGTPARASATASAPTDGFAMLNGYLNYPRKIDADWVSTLFILSAFSFENYYGVPGLARDLLAPEYYDVARKAYEREPFDAADIPTDLKKLINKKYFDPDYFANTIYGRLMAQTQVYQRVINTPTRNFYGETDEAISIGNAKLTYEYQRAIGNDKVEVISTGPTSHRGTYAKAVPEWKSWFDSLIKK